MYNLQTKTLENYGNIRYVTIDNQKWYSIYDLSETLGLESPFYVFLDEIKHSDRKIIEYAESSGQIATLPVINETGVRILLEDCDEDVQKDALSQLYPPIVKNGVKLFNNDDLKIRARIILENDGSILINAEDIAIGLGWSQEKDGKQYVKWERFNHFCVGLGYSPQVGKNDFLPESLFYRLAMKANNEVANKFQSWLANTVIPSIRQNGGYIKNQENLSVEETLANAVLLAQNVINQKQQENQKLKSANQALLQINEEMKPKADFHDAVAETYDAITVGRFAGILSNDNGLTIGQNKLFEYLRMRQYLCSASHLWNKPSQQMISKGYMLYKESIRKGELKFTPYITGSGQIFLTKKILENASFFEKKTPQKKIEYKLDRNGMEIRL